MRFRTIRNLALVAPFLLAGACAPADQADEGAETDTAPAETEETETAAPAPDTTAAALWAHLAAASFEENWALWPEKGELYQGQAPHGALLTSYLNPAAMDALTNQAGTMPDGAIIVKENYAPDSTLAATTVMFKSAGYDPDNNDWFWLKRAADGTVEVSGRGQGCIGCHSGAADNDYILTQAF